MDKDIYFTPREVWPNYYSPPPPPPPPPPPRYDFYRKTVISYILFYLLKVPYYNN